MFALNLLGGAALEGRDGPVTGRAAHRRRLALLAILSVARGRAVGRERIIGVLWPDHRTDAARHLLSESLYVLRKELGEDAFVATGDEVGLNTEVVRCDVAEFDRTVEEGSLEQAVRLYRGPFLDGFYVAGAPDFERWVEGERDRLARQFARALECLAGAAEGAGRPREAAEWWRRLAVHDPYNSRVGIRLMQALDEAGERAAALWFAETHVGLLREELGVAPDAEFAALVNRLRSGPVRMPAPEPPPVCAPAAPPFPVAPGSPATSSAAVAAGADAGRDDAAPPSASPRDDDARSAVESAAPPPADPPARADSPIAAPADPSTRAEPTPAARVDASTRAESPIAVPAAPSTREAPGTAAPAQPSPRAERPAAAPADRSAHVESAPADGASQPDPTGPNASAGTHLTRDSSAPGAADAVADLTAVAPSAAPAPQETGSADAGDGVRPPGMDAKAKPAGGTEEGRVRPRSVRGVLVQVAAFAGVLLGLAAAALAGALQPGREAAAAPGYDPRRIAVLYFDDYSRGGELGYLANGLTESLIHALSQVEALDVISRNGVKPYRERAVLFDSMVADLRVGSVVEGSVQRAGDSVRVTVLLIDASTQSHLESRTVTRALAEGIAVEDALAAEVSGFLRRRLGREVQLRAGRSETYSSAAWEAVLRAQQAGADALALGGTGDPRDAASADRLLARADSLLAAAERDDPRWTRPVLLRAWGDFRRASLAEGARGAAFYRAAYGRANAVLAREPRNARALEVRGTVRFRLAVSATDGARQAAELDGAERDLRAAVAAEPALAAAWSTLSALLRVRGNLAESDLAARRALAEDAYLDRAEDILHRLYIGALVMGNYGEAHDLCTQGRRRAPGDWRFVECRLALLRDDPSQPADPALARSIARELERVDPPARAHADGRAYTPAYRLALEAAVLARAGQHDSARAVLARARRETRGDTSLGLSLMYDEAAVRLLMGDSAGGRALLDRVLHHRPALRAFAERDPLFRGLFAASATGSPTGAGASRVPRDP